MVKVFVGNLSGSSVTERDLRSCFEQIGPVTEVAVMDRGGFAFVHMEHKDDAERAVTELNGTQCCGTALSVERARGRKGVVEDVKLFVANLDKEKISDQDLKDAFGKYGTVTEAVVVDRFGFVHMDSKDDAKIAIDKLHRSDLQGCTIDVKLSTSGSNDRNRRDGGRSRDDRYRDRGDYRDDRRDSMRFGDRSRDRYYDEYYGSRRSDLYDRRGPPPPDPYYRGSRFDPRDDLYSRGPPPRREARDAYYDDYRRGSDPYRQPPPARDPYPYSEPSSYERDPPARRDYQDDLRGAYPPPPTASTRRSQNDTYESSSQYGVSRSQYDQSDMQRRSLSGFKTEAYEDNYAAAARGAPPTQNPYAQMSSEYPGEKRSFAESSSLGDGYRYADEPPAAKRAYGLPSSRPYGY